MNKIIDITDESNISEIDIIGESTLSTGDSLDVSSRYTYDYSRRPVSIVHRRRNTALTATLQMAFNGVSCVSAGVDMMQHISALDQLCGRRIRLLWSGLPIYTFVVKSVQISGSIDCNDIFQAAQVSLSLTEGFVRRETIYTKVSVL